MPPCLPPSPTAVVTKPLTEPIAPNVALLRLVSPPVDTAVRWNVEKLTPVTAVTSVTGRVVVTLDPECIGIVVLVPVQAGAPPEWIAYINEGTMLFSRFPFAYPTAEAAARAIYGVKRR